MARLPRVSPIGIPQYVIQRGNNRQVCFASEQDFYAYIGWLKDYADKYQVEVHAWVLMTDFCSCKICIHHIPVNNKPCTFVVYTACSEGD